ncbi:MAG: hypothetical protein ACOYMV_11915 [Verrucomicrobiia bacterium]
MKAIIWLTDTNRYASPVVYHTGLSGAQHAFTWNDKHQAHIYGGKEMDAAEFNGAAMDIFCGPPTYFHPVAKLIEEAAPETVDDAFEAVSRLNTRKHADRKKRAR